MQRSLLALFLVFLSAAPVNAQPPVRLPWIKVDTAQKGFITHDTNTPFCPWGFNYDHDAQGRLLEDYWETEWTKIENDFRQMRYLGANVVRIHLQFGRFCPKPKEVHASALQRLKKLLQLAEREGLYLDLTGLGCYHKQDVPTWYDQLGEHERWEAQAFFWRAVARVAADAPAVFCYDLMNEPVVPGGKRSAGAWLGPPFGDKHFVQFITLEQANRPRPQIARAWTKHLVQAIRQEDTKHLITIGMVDWSLDRPGLTSGFVPQQIAPELDFIAVHLYPEAKKLAEAKATLQGFQVGKPVVVEETFPLRCSGQQLEEFIDQHRGLAQGWISFYWGGTLDDLRASQKLPERLLLDWLERFQKRAKQMHQPPR